MWEFQDFESERESSVCWPNNKIIDVLGKSGQILKKPNICFGFVLGISSESYNSVASYLIDIYLIFDASQQELGLFFANDI